MGEQVTNAVGPMGAEVPNGNTDHFQGLFHSDLDGRVDSLLLRYTRHVATHGVPARDTGRIQERVKTRPHLSAREHLDEIMASIWADAIKGRVLLCTDPQGKISAGRGCRPGRSGPEVQAGQDRGHEGAHDSGPAAP